jgi:hypothetical protein
MVVTRQEYESKIARLQNGIVKAQKTYDSHYFDKMIKPRADKLTTDTRYGNPMCKGGGNACWEEIRQNEIRWNNMEQGLTNNIQNAKQALWDYQKRIAKEEQEAQVEAVRQAIADQVRLEQERIQQSEQNQIIMQEAPLAEPEPIATMEPDNNLTEAKILPQNFKLPFNENYLIPIIAIGGYFVLRDN